MTTATKRRTAAAGASSNGKADERELVKAEKEVQQAEDIEQIAEGAPIPFEINGKMFAIRQPEAGEYDRIRAEETRRYHIEMLQPGMDELAQFPVSDDALALRRVQIEAAEALLKDASSEDERIDLEERLKRLRRPDTRTRAEEVATHASQRARDRWIFEHLLVMPDGSPVNAEDRKRLMRSAQAFEDARIAIWRALVLASELPNWTTPPA